MTTMRDINLAKLKEFLDQKAEQYNTPDFIQNDPISIPHSYDLKQDKEIMGFFAAIFAWGQRKTIINKCRELGERMDNAPYQFVKQHNKSDLKKLLGFKHRTFNDTDLLYSIEFMKMHFSTSDSMECAFFPESDMDAESALNYFRTYFFSLDSVPDRTRKHITSPSQKSACKRLNLYLRWMVRDDNRGVDFGLWRNVKPSKLITPLDLHVERTARLIGLLERDNVDWKAAVELTENLRILDADDPVKYDYALFGISIEEKCII